MRVAVLAGGSIADFEPLVALARALTDAGAEVSLAGPASGAGLASGLGHFTAFGRVGPDGGTAPLTRRLAARAMLAASTTAVEQADALVYASDALAGPHLAERFGLPSWRVDQVPTVKPAAPSGPVASLLDRAEVSSWRAGLGLPRRARPVPASVLGAYPIDLATGAETEVTGIWTMPEPPAAGHDSSPRALVDVRDAECGIPDLELANQAVAACRRVALGVVLIGFPELAASDVEVIDRLPDPAVLRGCRVALVTRSAAVPLRLGVPTAVVPAGAAGLFWAGFVSTRGVGERIEPRGISAGRIGHHLGLGRKPGVARRAAHLGHRWRAEPGASRAARLVISGR